ncbi:protein of unknown function [Aminobacter niigataensis]|nr:protein of unknown function [Aminobacter niigataensis]
MFSKCLKFTGDPPRYEGTPHAAILHYANEVSGPDAYETTEDGEIKAPARNALSHWDSSRFFVHIFWSSASGTVYVRDSSTFACTWQLLR